MSAPSEKAVQGDAVDREIDALVAEFGDWRQAMRALLHDLETVAADRNSNVSAGFVRNEVIRIKRRVR